MRLTSKRFLLGCTVRLALNVGPAANTLPRLRIIENGIVAINLMFRGKVVRVGSRPMLNERRADGLF